MVTAMAYEGTRLWTEEEYLALEETSERFELFDGRLYVTSGPTPDHQDIVFQLKAILLPSVRKAGLRVSCDINVRLWPGTIPRPDLAIVEPIDGSDPIVEVAKVRLVAEAISPGNASHDRVTKMRYYAKAGIPFYLLVEQEPIALYLFRLAEFSYVEVGRATGVTALHLTEPVGAEISPADLRIDL